jgi:HTH-type transcriptional regulator/antitoxin HigA
MSTTLADPAEMIHLGAPHIIRNDEELAEYTRVLFNLTAKEITTSDEDEAIDLLTLLIESYEAKHYPIGDFGGEGNVSLVLSGKRDLNREHIARLSKRFKVSPAVFFSAVTSTTASSSD